MAKKGVKNSEVSMNNYCSRLKKLFFNPKKFFKDVDGEKNYKNPLITYIIIGLVSVVLSLIMNIYLASVINMSGLVIIPAISNLVFGILILFITPFVYSVFVHIGVLVFRGKEKFYNTFKPLTYGLSIGQVYGALVSFLTLIFFLFIFSTDILLAIEQGNVPEDMINTKMVVFGVFMFVIYASMLIHMIYAEVIGISRFQKISKFRAFLSIVFVPVILILIGAIFYFIPV